MTRYCPDLVSTSDWLLIKYEICEEPEKQQQKGKKQNVYFTQIARDFAYFAYTVSLILGTKS